MDDKIRAELRTIEEERNVHIVNARERGARMLGVEHDNSDWDVMFLFTQDCSKYATLRGYIGTIDEPHRGEDENIDLHGWNVDKFGELLADSNPNAIEFCRRGATKYISYNGDELDTVAEEARQSFNHMALYYHYISMAKSNYAKYVESGNDCTKGRQFYVARAVACAAHIRNEGTMPPMEVSELTESNGLNNELAGVLGRLADAKRAGDGPQENPDIVGPLYEAESEAPMTVTDERINDPDTDVIDEFIENAVVR